MQDVERSGRALARAYRQPGDASADGKCFGGNYSASFIGFSGRPAQLDLDAPVGPASRSRLGGSHRARNHVYIARSTPRSRDCARSRCAAAHGWACVGAAAIGRSRFSEL